MSDREYGAPADDVFATAPVVVTARYRQQFLIPTSLEGRAVLARPDEDGGFTVWVSHQAQHRLRDGLARVFGLEPSQVRVVVPIAGGAFGAKSGSYPEYALACHLARLLGRPVRWVEDRAEALATSTRGRGQQQEARLAATEEVGCWAMSCGRTIILSIVLRIIRKRNSDECPARLARPAQRGAQVRASAA